MRNNIIIIIIVVVIVIVIKGKRKYKRTTANREAAKGEARIYKKESRNIIIVIDYKRG